MENEVIYGTPACCKRLSLYDLTLMSDVIRLTLLKNMKVKFIPLLVLSYG